ncbi:MAG TPA: Gfo/Idh/MocA family oxidoreductase [Verrucomicrobiae bacterium]|nr:Gfo/Idh/MocA family oxidoreductase [Verrucomicrobiae bacterium]
MKFSPASTSRREFLRQLSVSSTAIAAGIGFSGRLHAQPATAPVKTDKKLGVALLGLGRYATGQLGPALQVTKDCRLAGVVTGHPEKAAQWAEDFSLPEKNLYNYKNFDRIAENPDIDIVYVVTPPALHPEFVIRAAKAGKHVISEKPMATSVADCDAMIAACRAAKVKLSIGYRLHFDPYLRELMRHQREKDFGEFTKLTGDRGFVFGEHAWRVEKKLAGGGPLMDLGIYIIQAACMATGATPVAVMAQEEPKLRPDFFNEVEKTIRFKLEFASGATCEAVTSYNHNNDTFRAEGAKGWYEFSAHAFSYKVGTVNSSLGPVKFPAPISQQALHMDDFADCIRTGRESEVNGEMGRRDMKIITAIYEAARTGKRVIV